MRVAGLLLGVSVAACRPPHPLESVVPPVLERDRIHSAVVVLGTKDGVDWRRSFGAAAPDTIFDLASLTKAVGTATAAMKLVEEGRLSLDAPAGRYLKPFKARAETVRDLLLHRTGLPPYLKPAASSPDAILEEIAGLKTDKPNRYG